MLGRVFVVYDKVMQDSVMLFEARNDAVAVRSFRAFLVSTADASGDYRLLHVGFYDHEKSLISPVPVPVEIQVNLVDREGT